MGYKIQYGPSLTLQDLLELLEHAGNQTITSIHQNPLVGEGSQASRSEDARALFITGIALKQVAANLSEGDALASATDQAIADWEDDYCGTPPRPLPALALAASLAAFASTLQAGNLQTAIQEEAGRLARKAFGAGSVAQPTAVKAA